MLCLLAKWSEVRQGVTDQEEMSGGCRPPSAARPAVLLDQSQLERVVPGPGGCRGQPQTPCPALSVSTLLHLGHLWIGRWHSPINAKDHSLLFFFLNDQVV